MYQTGCVFVCTSADDNFNYRHLWKQSISLNQRKYILHSVSGPRLQSSTWCVVWRYQMLWRGSEQRTEVMYLNYILLDTICPFKQLALPVLCHLFSFVSCLCSCSILCTYAINMRWYTNITYLLLCNIRTRFPFTSAWATCLWIPNDK